MAKITKLPNGGELHDHYDGIKQWFLNGKTHREDGHAIEGVDGYKSWYINGKRHREDGPAIEYDNGPGEWKEWWVNGERLPCTTQVQFERLMRLKAFW